MWIYDFDKKQAVKLPEIREAIIQYWKDTEDINLDIKRWDIYPLGFDANDEQRVIVNAYAYTGAAPIFLGTWSIDINGEQTKLETLTSSGVPVSTTGYRLTEDEAVIPLSEIEYDAMQAKSSEKLKEKQEKADEKLNKEVQRLEYQRKIHQMDMQTLIKVKERQESLKQIKIQNTDGVTDNLGKEMKNEE